MTTQALPGPAVTVTPPAPSAPAFVSRPPSPRPAAGPPRPTAPPTTAPAPVAPGDSGLPTFAAPAASPVELESRLKAFADARGPLVWLRSLAVVAIEPGRVTITGRPGKREAVRFAETRRDQLEQLLTRAMAGPTKVELRPVEADAASPADADQPRPVHEEALRLPLVRELRELFDLTVMGVASLTADGKIAGAPPAGADADAGEAGDPSAKLFGDDRPIPDDPPPPLDPMRSELDDEDE